MISQLCPFDGRLLGTVKLEYIDYVRTSVNGSSSWLKNYEKAALRAASEVCKQRKVESLLYLVHYV